MEKYDDSEEKTLGFDKPCQPSARPCIVLQHTTKIFKKTGCIRAENSFWYNLLMENDIVAILVRVILAMVIGAVIGLERELKHKPAGIRTHMLVAGASALLLLINDEVVSQFTASEAINITADPTRIIQAIVVGISFIGAGTVLKSDKDQSILYLTTAASILFTAALGIIAGLGLYLLAFCLTVIVVSSLFGLGIIEKRYLD